jgi:hypothetical protein
MFIYQDCGAAVPFPPAERLGVQEDRGLPQKLEGEAGNASLDRGTLSKTGRASGEISLRAMSLLLL